MGERKTLPAVSLPKAGYDLLDRYARANRVSMSEAVRRICQTSPELLEFEKADDLSEYFEVKSWGGNRRGEREGDE